MLSNPHSFSTDVINQLVVTLLRHTGGGGTDSRSRELRCVKTGKKNSLDIKFIRLHLKNHIKLPN